MNKAIIIYDCWDKHWSADPDQDANCIKINTLIKHARAKGYTIIHHPSDCTKLYNNFLLHNVDIPLVEKGRHRDIKLPKTEYLNSITKHPEPGQKWLVWTKQNKHIDILKSDYITEDISELVYILDKHNIKDIYYVGYHINQCLLWTRPTSIGNLKQHMNINTHIIKDLSKTILIDDSNLETVYDICKEYHTTLINSKEI